MTPQQVIDLTHNQPDRTADLDYTYSASELADVILEVKNISKRLDELDARTKPKGIAWVTQVPLKPEPHNACSKIGCRTKTNTNGQASYGYTTAKLVVTGYEDKSTDPRFSRWEFCTGQHALDFQQAKDIVSAGNISSTRINII